jgi:diguanylate cyclase (GGDEF)-like protein/PAS domain S-box-containing protein
MKLSYFTWRSLKTRVTLLTLLTFVISIWAVTFYASHLLREDMQTELGEQQFSTISGIAREIDSRLSDRMIALQTVAKEVSPKVMTNTAALQTLLEQRPLLQLLFNGGVFITRTDGTAVADLPISTGRIGTNYLDRDTVSIPLKQGKTVIGRPAIGKKLGAPIFSISAPIFDGKGQVSGAIVGTINLEKSSFLDLITQNHYGKSGGFLLIAPQHQLVVTASDKSRVMQVVPAPGVNAMHDRYMAGYEGFGTALNSRGVLELSAAKRIPSADWFVVATLPANEAFAPIDHMLRHLLVNALAVTLLAGVLTWWLISRLLRQQFAPLHAASQAIALRSNADQPIQALPVSRDDEIGELISDFNTLLEKYADREKLLKASETFKDVILDAMDAEIAVVDRGGVIRAVNALWLEFAVDNDSEQDKSTTRTGVGTNYLEICRGASGTQKAGTSDVHTGLAAVLEGRLKSFNCEYRCDSPTQERWFSMTIMPLSKDGNVGAVITHRDITNGKLAEAALVASEERWKFAIEGAGDGLFDWQVQTGKAYYSPRYKAMLGFAEEELSDSADEWSKRLHPEDAPGVYAALQPYLDGKPGNATVEFRMLRKDGRWMWTLGRGMVVQRDANGAALRLIGTNSDITERKRAESKLQLAASVFEHAREGIMISNTDGTIIDVNEAFTRITGYSREEAIGQNPRLLSSGRQDRAFYEAMWGALTAQGHWSGELWNRHKNGHVYAELLTISAVRQGQGDAHQYVALFSDITAIKEHQSQLEHIAHFDALTNLPNRLLLADRLQQAMAQAQRRNQKVAVAYLDIDGFKSVNDRYGHDAGDQLLIHLAKVMKDTLREGDTLARLGGDEFVAVMIDLDGVESCLPMLTRLLEAGAAPLSLGDIVLQGSASVGVTFYPQEIDVEADQLLRQADQAMYQAKMAGKNRYHLFDAAHDSSLRMHHEGVEGMRMALARGELVLHYQPKVNMRAGKVIGVEALIRWQHPEKGLLTPAHFLPAIEDNPLAVEVGEWVIDTALAQIEAWLTMGMDLTVSVNIGARQLQQGNFVERLQTILARHPKVNPIRLELEVLETSALADMELVSQVIEDCRQLGVKFALDDFGTGYSSLTYLKRLRVAILKIDQSFVRDMLVDSDDLAILEGVIGLAAAFKREVIAEGVETIAHGTALMNLGCELAQGYGIARPMPAEQVAAWTTTWEPDAAWCQLPWLGGAPDSRFE